MPISRDLLTTHITDTTNVLAVNSEISRLGDHRYRAALEFDHDEYSARRGSTGAIAIPTTLDLHVTKPNFEKDGNIHHSKRDNFTVPTGSIVYKAWTHIGLTWLASVTIKPFLGSDDLGATSAISAGSVTNHTANIGTELMASDTEVFVQLSGAAEWTAGSLTLFIEYYYTDTVSTVS